MKVRALISTYVPFFSTQIRPPSVSNAIASIRTNGPSASVGCDNSAASNKVGGHGGIPGGWKYALLAATVPLVMLAGCDYIDKLMNKKKKKGESSEPTPATLKTKKKIPDNAYAIGKSAKIKLPKNGRLPRWRAKRMIKQAERDARKTLKKELRYLFQRHIECHKKKLKPTITKELEKEVITKGANGARMVHYEYRILWTEAVCKWSYRVGAYRVRTDSFTVGNPNLR